MIRACYEALAWRLNAYFGNSQNKGIVLLGHPVLCFKLTPHCSSLLAARLMHDCLYQTTTLSVKLSVAGIGKTYLGYLMLHRLALQGQRVVYHQFGSGPLLFCAEGAFQLADIRPELDRSDTWWVLATQGCFKSQTILVQSGSCCRAHVLMLRVPPSLVCNPPGTW